MKTILLSVVIVAAGCASSAHPSTKGEGDAAPAVTKESLGALIFNDATLSEPAGQSCATCHDSKHGYADGRGHSTSEGAVAGRFGVRNAPAIAYAVAIPALLPAVGDTGFSGGMFWDGRVNTMARQAAFPLTNPLEMNNADANAVLAKIKAAGYSSQFVTLYGDNALADADTALANLGDAVAAFETILPGYVRLSSKYDAYLVGKATLTADEMSGLELFEDKATGPCTPQPDGSMAPPCGCAQCHLDQVQADGSPPLFTDFGYDNIGIPRNATNPFYQLPTSLNPGGADFVDDGLATFIGNTQQTGHFKAPSLRNVALTGPYGHNGYFATLKDIIHFYNTRDVPGAWPAPEQSSQMNLTGLGNLQLTDQNENDIVTFLGTLTDGFFDPAL